MHAAIITQHFLHIEAPCELQILEESDIDVGSCQESFKDTIQGEQSSGCAVIH